MDTYLAALDEHFCTHYSDYVRLSALEGYEMPEVLTVGPDGNITRRDPSVMRLCYQKNKAALLARLKAELEDTTFTFSFSFPKLRDRLRRPFEKYTFAKVLPVILSHTDETPASVGEKLSVEPVYWRKIVKGTLYPEKNTVLAVALAARMRAADFNRLMAVCGFTLTDDNVRDVVVGYLLANGIFNGEMRDRCLAEYKISNLPLRHE